MKRYITIFIISFILSFSLISSIYLYVKDISSNNVPNKIKTIIDEPINSKLFTSSLLQYNINNVIADLESKKLALKKEIIELENQKSELQSLIESYDTQVNLFVDNNEKIPVEDIAKEKVESFILGVASSLCATVISSLCSKYIKEKNDNMNIIN